MHGFRGGMFKTGELEMKSAEASPDCSWCRRSWLRGSGLGLGIRVCGWGFKVR